MDACAHLILALSLTNLLTRLGELNKTFHPYGKLQLLFTNPLQSYGALQQSNDSPILGFYTSHYVYTLSPTDLPVPCIAQIRARAITLRAP